MLRVSASSALAIYCLGVQVSILSTIGLAALFKFIIYRPRTSHQSSAPYFLSVIATSRPGIPRRPLEDGSITDINIMMLTEGGAASVTPSQVKESVTHLSPGISLISDLVHDSGMLQSDLFTWRSQNLVLAKLPNSGFLR